jgi:hypothetical protein
MEPPSNQTEREEGKNATALSASSPFTSWKAPPEGPENESLSDLEGTSEDEDEEGEEEEEGGESIDGVTEPPLRPASLAKKGFAETAKSNKEKNASKRPRLFEPPFPVFEGKATPNPVLLYFHSHSHFLFFFFFFFSSHRQTTTRFR